MRDRAENGVKFKNRRKKIYDGKNEEYDVKGDRAIQEMCPYPEVATEFPGVELEREGTTPLVKEEEEIDENEEATGLNKIVIWVSYQKEMNVMRKKMTWSWKEILTNLT